MRKGPSRAQRRPGPWGDGGVDVGDGGDALLHEVERLLPEGRLQAVGDVAFGLAAQADGMLADGAVEGHGAIDGVGRGPDAADDLHKRDEVRRVEGVAEDDAPGVGAAGLDVADEEGAGAGGEDGVGGGGGVECGEQRLFEVEPFGTVLLDEVGPGDGGFGACREHQVPGGRGRVLRHHGGPECLDLGAEGGFGAGCRVEGGDVEAAAEEECGPARADDAGADDGDGADGRRTVRHQAGTILHRPGVMGRKAWSAGMVATTLKKSHSDVLSAGVLVCTR